ncbi:hypothetical protein KUTeg_018482 [Tegillarca granosa]|uniref:Major facilitator superfamily (MFS) profile domain-containing protein n=1 Tax=Tegillarca granosa TaxID=220873 RepID=A0ABQ9EHZ8_TEGGR|nr:hypothetical protein KUTeg_018482 [Tegillarca granosa]
MALVQIYVLNTFLQWDLVCDKDALGKMSQTLVLGGMFLGAFASPLADKFGRRPVHCAFNIGYFIVTILVAFITNFKAFMVLRFLTGVCQQVDLAPWAPGVLFGVMCFIIAILLRFVPETKGKELAQTVEELKQWENKKF